ncbi:delta-1-pyrroline-5-carboxylate dehydrogenase, mitochondrial [Neodiprion pinetum]|uniref:Multifunctional fusion protein n=1 Tax=Neodiprion lecontei TaxID=441921 RepID=A0A6J0BME1_NEOLC|nr:delta-1-pyrroline-5-carboxylate dehydrogenase, mitochondrial [Neodiprion lecontei]XP_046421722.1 delta-1-pyrroline-5-carboxylate dehydrogenase, mitochondrial [Neodiprion fabricii]XP_046475859.1 delta-1-pyrroline-5-carboxylate dehydrogenase, mitochondrial [Neodiprion pinetum]
MLSVCRQAVISGGQKTGIRSLSSVVPVICPPEFPLENEPVLGYEKNSKERANLQAALKVMSSEVEDVPIVIGSEEFRTDNYKYQVMPHNHKHKIAKFYYATPELVQKAIDVAVKTQREWERYPIEKRLEIWLKAAELMQNKYRQNLNAATMLGQSKTVIQAEIDSSAELIDFFKINGYFAKEAIKYKPISPDPKETLNSMRYRGMDGFVAAISPFNFTAIGGNLSYTPALMGNGVLWKPSDTAVLSNWWIFKICKEAGVPPGVVNFIPCDGPVFGNTITASPYLSGINFTGSVPTFNRLWTQVGNNVNKYKNYPKMIGECGGKNYHFVHPSADITTVVIGTIKSAFEYNGQKCSACSRMYVPQSLWGKIKEGLLETRDKLKIGDVQDFTSFTSAVIDKNAFKRITSYIEHAKSSNTTEIIGGGTYDDSQGYFVQPTIIVSKDPKDKLMTEEIFGPVLTIYVYKDADLESTLKLVESSTPYALTGAIFSKDLKWARYALDELKYTAGNFYINDKSTGSVVGQQPFGGSRMSGTNDKAGGPHYALRWASPQAIKETFVPQTTYDYKYMRS